MIDLETTYLGLPLPSPIVPSSSPLLEKLDNLLRLEEAGAGAVVLPSLFEEQLTKDSLELDERLSQGTDRFAEALNLLPDLEQYNMGPERYLESIQKAKAALSIPVIASLNGNTLGSWVRYAKEIEQAGADALELNVYHIPADLLETGHSVESKCLELVKAVKSELRIPLAVKLSPYFSSIGNMALEIDQVKADGLVLFNRFYQPDIDLEELEVVSNLQLSTPEELRLRLRWTALLYGQISADLGITGGVYSASDALKCLMAGGKVVMMASALLKHGISHLKKLLEAMVRWMEEHDYESVEQLRGSMSRKAIGASEGYERVQYVRLLAGYLR
ncbi:MAG: dihydroorotate dehydrogenase-like protein [Coprothermobacterota bacterium]|nr:dihydroorotate dehydrogenase-like protein [Coprothermobacterota bacterium]